MMRENSAFGFTRRCDFQWICVKMFHGTFPASGGLSDGLIDPGWERMRQALNCQPSRMKQYRERHQRGIWSMPGWRCDLLRAFFLNPVPTRGRGRRAKPCGGGLGTAQSIGDAIAANVGRSGV